MHPSVTPIMRRTPGTVLKVTIAEIADAFPASTKYAHESHWTPHVLKATSVSSQLTEFIRIEQSGHVRTGIP